MQVYVGSTRKLEMVKRITEMEWGRLWTDRCPTPYQIQKTTWALDNNVFAHFRKGEKFDADSFMLRLHKLVEHLDSDWELEDPDFIVLPDIVGGGFNSLCGSAGWCELILQSARENGGAGVESIPWALVVQDGMSVTDVHHMLEHYAFIDGLFLGGSDEFKATAPAWVRLANSYGKWLHYGRAGTPTKVKHAIDSGASSLDSAFPLWTMKRFDQFVELFN